MGRPYVIYRRFGSNRRSFATTHCRQPTKRQHQQPACGRNRNSGQFNSDVFQQKALIIASTDGAICKGQYRAR